jgi:hypothetical protein
VKISCSGADFLFFRCVLPTNMNLAFTRGTKLGAVFIKLVDFLEAKSIKLNIIAESQPFSRDFTKQVMTSI